MSEGRACLVWQRDPLGDLRILHAEPHATLSVDLLNEIREGQATWGDLFEGSIEGDIVRIRAVNRTVVYRLGEEIPGGGAYYAEWPD